MKDERRQIAEMLEEERRRGGTKTIEEGERLMRELDADIAEGKRLLQEQDQYEVESFLYKLEQKRVHEENPENND